MNDGALYTGVDGEIDGMFGNETTEDSVKELVQAQQHQLRELTPQLEGIITMLDNERATVLEFIAGYVDNTKDLDENYRAELKAAGRYRTYLGTLKTKFELALNETKGK